MTTQQLNKTEYKFVSARYERIDSILRENKEALEQNNFKFYVNHEEFSTKLEVVSKDSKKLTIKLFPNLIEANLSENKQKFRGYNAYETILDEDEWESLTDQLMKSHFVTHLSTTQRVILTNFFHKFYFKRFTNFSLI